MRALFRLCLVLLAAGCCAGHTNVAEGQLLRPRRTLPPPDAIVGPVFGVGRVSLQAPEARPSFFGERDFVLHERNNRVFYAAFVSEPVRAVLRDILNRPQNVTVFFLFIGEEPLDLSLSVAGGGRIRVQPRRDDGAHGRLLDNWWQEYTEGAAARRAPASIRVWWTSTFWQCLPAGWGFACPSSRRACSTLISASWMLLWVN